jgi:hypothetical protein
MGDVTPEGYSLWVDVVDDRNATFYLSDPVLLEEYDVETEEGEPEYNWTVGFSSPEKEYNVDLTVYEGEYDTEFGTDKYVQSSFWHTKLAEPEGNLYEAGDVPFEIADGAIVWTVTVPPDVLAEAPDFSFYDFSAYYMFIKSLDYEWTGNFSLPEGATEAEVEPINASWVSFANDTGAIEFYDQVDMLIASGDVAAAVELYESMEVPVGPHTRDDMTEEGWQALLDISELETTIVQGDSYQVITRFPDVIPASEPAAEAPMEREEGAIPATIFSIPDQSGVEEIVDSITMQTYLLLETGIAATPEELADEILFRPSEDSEMLQASGVEVSAGNFTEDNMPGEFWQVLLALTPTLGESTTVIETEDEFYVMTRFG